MVGLDHEHEHAICCGQSGWAVAGSSVDASTRSMFANGSKACSACNNGMLLSTDRSKPVNSNDLNVAKFSESPAYS